MIFGKDSREGRKQSSRSNQVEADESTYGSKRHFSLSELVIPLVRPHVCLTGTPNWALTVKTTVPILCTPPFPKILSSRVRYG
jgi:hypothetical protein